MRTPVDPPIKQDLMVEQQIVARGVTDQRVIEAMKWIPRDRFVPQELERHAFDDAPATIGHGQTISQPYIVALMTEALDIQPQHRVLEIGTGSGYQAAILARLGGEVYTVERIKILLDEAFERLSSLHIRNIHFKFGDGSLGWSEQAPFDRIILTAAVPDVADSIFAQLADGGICVAPVGPKRTQELLKYVKKGTKIERHVVTGVRFVPMIGDGGFDA